MTTRYLGVDLAWSERSGSGVCVLDGDGAILDEDQLHPAVLPWVVRRVLEAPEQRLAVRRGRDVLQSRVSMEGKEYLVRVFVDVDRSPAEVVTAYRTSRIARYWRAEP